MISESFHLMRAAHYMWPSLRCTARRRGAAVPCLVSIRGGHISVTDWPLGRCTRDDKPMQKLNQTRINCFSIGFIVSPTRPLGSNFPTPSASRLHRVQLPIGTKIKDPESSSLPGVPGTRNKEDISISSHCHRPNYLSSFPSELQPLVLYN